jgi:hypothetical protein
LIKIGLDRDGAYFIPDDLKDISYCFSPGVSDICDFELSLANDYGIHSFMIDYSVDSPPVSHDLFDFDKLFLSSVKKKNSTTLDEWINTKIPNYQDDLILQIDIEGAEYEVFNNLQNFYLKKFRIIVIEFHFLNNLILKNKFYKINNTFEKILDFFYIVHAHPNNASILSKYHDMLIPNTLEVTFIRKDRLNHLKPRPKSLILNDITNSIFYDPIPLPDLWWK